MLPPSSLRCQVYVGDGFPDAATVKVAGEPEVTDWATGWVVKAGAVLDGALMPLPPPPQATNRSMEPENQSGVRFTFI